MTAELKGETGLQVRAWGDPRSQHSLAFKGTSSLLKEDAFWIIDPLRTPQESRAEIVRVRLIKKAALAKTTRARFLKDPN